MTRSELITSLADLKDKYIISRKEYEKYQMKLPMHFSDSYSAERDPRFKDLFNYISPSDPGFDTYLKYFSFVVVANIPRDCIEVPDMMQISEMLEICEYTPDEMEDYIFKSGMPIPWCVPEKSYVQVIYLLARALSEAIKDKSIWQGYKNGKRKKGYKQPKNLSMVKLQKVVEYMEDQELIDLDPSDVEEYNKYIKDHSLYYCIAELGSSELDMLDNHFDKLAAAKNREASAKLAKIKKKQKIEASPRAMQMPFADPSALKGPVQLSDKIERPAFNVSLSPNSSMRDYLFHNPQKPIAVSIIEEEINNCHSDFSATWDECWGRYETLRNEYNARRNELFKDEDIHAVASGAFQSILLNDETYKYVLGRLIIEEFMSNCNMPVPTIQDIKLEDNDEWKYTEPENNGKLALPVVTEDDTVTSNIIEIENSKFTTPLSTIISRYSKHPFEGPLYIRKSIVKKFKKWGFSDRKARDYAIIVAVLSKINVDEYKDYPLAARFPEKLEITEPEETDDINKKLELALQARSEAERHLKQARKENKEYRHEIRVLQKEIEQLKQQAIRQEESEVETVTEIERAPVDEISFPYKSDLKIVLFGGFDTFHLEILKYFPDIRIMEPAAHLDVAPVRNADIVFIQINKTNHGCYWAVRDACKNSGVPYRHLNYSSAKRCAEVMVEEIRKLNLDSPNKL